MSESANRRIGETATSPSRPLAVSPSQCAPPPEVETENRRAGETAASPSRPLAVSPSQSALPPGLTAEQLAAHERRVAARERAASVPLPGPLGDAFAACAASGLLRTGESANRRSGDIAASPSRPLADSLPSPSHLRPVSLRDFIFLRAWQHPLYDELCGAEARSWTQNELDQVAALFREQKSEVREQTGAAGPLTSDLRSLTSALISDFRALFHQAFSTIVSFVPANRDGSITISSGPEDGVGWWLSLYRFLIMDCHFAPDAALDYPLCQAWALRAAHHDRNPLLEMDGDGYIAQEEQRLKAKG